MWSRRYDRLLLVAHILILTATYNVDASDEQEALECGLYIAESTVPNAGLGIFTGVTKEKGDAIGNGDVCIPLFDIHWNNDEGFFYPFQDYVWNGGVMGMQLEIWEKDIEAYWPGIDCLVNCDLAFLNVLKSTPNYDESGLHRSKHPGAGAISPYRNGITKVSRTIPAGGELFKFYGDSWFTSRPQKFAKDFPLTKDYEDAEALLKAFKDIVDEDNQSAIYDMIMEMRSFWNSSNLNALPPAFEDAQNAILAGDIGAAYQERSVRSLEYLQKHGRCIDHIASRLSNIEGSGDGAFAKRDLPKGTVISASPLHHLPTRRFIEIFVGVIDDEDERYRSDEVYTEQVIVNYCWGHSRSTLLLCPYGAGIGYINHNQTLANVRIAWAPNGTMSHGDDWFDVAPEKMSGHSQTHLAFEYITTRDIQEGEELYLDYGDEWENAWAKHVAEWEIDEDWPDYVSAHQLNKMTADDEIRTLDEQENDPYPEELEIRCHSDLISDSYDRNKPIIWDGRNKGHPCDVVGRHASGDDGNIRYDVVIAYDKTAVDGGHFRGYDEDEDEDDSVAAIKLERFNVGRAAISFVDLPYTTDLHLAGTFRHPMGIPDEIFPQAWRNINKK